MPRLYREAPLASIWEGSGNVMSLDVLRALTRSPRSLEVFLDEVEQAARRRRAPGRARRAAEGPVHRPRHARAARAARRRRHGAVPAGLAARAQRPRGGRRRLLRVAAGRRRRPRVRHAAGGHRLRGDHRALARARLSAHARSVGDTAAGLPLSYAHTHELPAGPHLRHPHRRQRELVRRPVLPDLLAVHRLLPRRCSAARRRPPTLVAVAGALGYFASLILHELGHALVARRLGHRRSRASTCGPSAGSRACAASPQSAGEEFKIAAAGPVVTLALFALCLGGGHRARQQRAPSPTWRCRAAALTTTPALALLGWLGFINAALFVFNLVPAFPLDGGRIAHARDLVAHRRPQPRDARDRARRPGASRCCSALLGLWAFATGGASLGLITMVLAFFLYQAAGAAVVQGTLGRRIQDITVADIMDREPVTIPAEVTLLDAQEQFFLRYRWPWFAVVDPGAPLPRRRAPAAGRGRDRRRAPGAAGRGRARGGHAGADRRSRRRWNRCSAPKGSAASGAMVAVDEDGVLQGVVTLAQVRGALRPAQPTRPAT